MHNVLNVAIVERLQDLTENHCGLRFLKELSLDDPVEELATGAQFSDQVDVDVVLEVLVEFDDVGVILFRHMEALVLAHLITYQGLQDLDFRQEAIPVANLGTRDLFDGAALAGCDMLCCSYLAVGALTKLLEKKDRLSYVC